jgi:hypothetical protein
MEHPELKAAKSGATGNISIEKRIALPYSPSEAMKNRFRRTHKITPTSTAIGVISALYIMSSPAASKLANAGGVLSTRQAFLSRVSL